MCGKTKDVPVMEPWNIDLASDIIAEFKSCEGPMLPILHAFQETFGCVPEDAAPLIAEKLNLSRAEVYGVITFYHDFRRAPAGQHVVKLCRAEACQSVGCNELVAQAERKLGISLGATTADGRVTLEPTFCLGLCSTGPSAMVDGQLVGRLTENKLDQILMEVSR